MTRGAYGLGKRQREADKARKRQEKEQRRRDKRERGPGEVAVTTVEEMTGALPPISEALDAVHNRPAAPRRTVPARLFVGGLTDAVTAEELRAVFEKFGPVDDAFIVMDRDTRTPRGFGFVTMANHKDATKAIEGLHGTDVDGRAIVVNLAAAR